MKADQPETPAPAPVKDDPTRPYKAYIAAVIAALTEVLATSQDTLPWWAVLIIGGVVAGLTTFAVPNPKR
jgi:hypothetical protein